MLNAQQKTSDDGDVREQVWAFAKEMHVCMLTSWDGQKQHSRPMTPHVMHDEHAIYFLDKQDSAKEKEIEAFPAVGLTFMAPNRNTYLNISGTAKVTNDRALIKKLWSSVYKNWWTSEDDPTIRVISFTPDVAELWDGPNSLVAAGIMLIAATTGAKLSMGKNEKVSL